MERFRQVNPQAVVFPRFLGPERNHVEVQPAAPARGKLQPGFRVALFGGEFKGVVFPVGGQPRDGTLRQLTTIGVDELDRDGSDKAVGRARRQREDVGFPRHDVHAPVTRVFQREGALGLNAQGPTIEGIQRSRLVDGGSAGAAGQVGEFPIVRLVGVLE